MKILPPVDNGYPSRSKVDDTANIDKPLRKSTDMPPQAIQSPWYSGVSETKADGIEQAYER